MKIKNIFEPIFNTHLLFIYDCKAFDAEDYLRRQGIETSLVRNFGQLGSYKFTKDNDKEWQQIRYYIWLERGQEKTTTLYHELSHLIFLSLFDCGIKITRDTDETFCYYLEWWIKEIKKIFK